MRANLRAILFLIAILGLATFIRIEADKSLSPSAHEYEYFITYSGNIHPVRHDVNRIDYIVSSIAPKYQTLDRLTLIEDNIESNGYFYSWFVEHIWIKWFFSTQGGSHMRILPFIFGILTLYLVYILGKMVHSRRVGLLATFLLAIHGMHIAHSVHGRFYTMNEFFCVLSTILIIKVADKPTWKNILSYIICAVGVVGTQLLTIALILPHMLYLLYRSCDRKRAVTIAIASCIAVFSVWIALYLRDTVGYTRFDYGYPLDNNIFFKFLFCLLASNLFAEKVCEDSFALLGPYTVITIDAYVTAVGCITGLSLFSVWLGRGQLKVKDKWDKIIFVWGICLIALVGYWIFSTFVKNIVVTRNYSWMLPFFSILTATGLSFCHKYLRLAFLALTFCASVYTSSTIFFQGRGEEFIIDIVRAHRRPGELVVLEDYVKLNHRLPNPDNMIAPTMVISPLTSAKYILNVENLGEDLDGTKETVVRGRSMSSFLRMMCLYRGDFLHGKRMWIVAHNQQPLIYDLFILHQDRGKILMYRDFGSEAIFYVEFK